MTSAHSSVHTDDAPLLVHEAVIYSNPEQLVAVAEPFLHDGLTGGEAAFVATTEVNAGLLAGALGGDADRVGWTDAAAWYRNPVETIKAYQTYIRGALDAGAPRVRIVGEPVWPTDSPTGVVEWERYESMLNLLLAPLPAWVICPYDATRIAETIIANAHRTHPLVLHAGAHEASARYQQPSEFFAALDAEHELPPPPPGARTHRVGHRFEQIADVRRLVVAEAAGAGLGAKRIRDLELVAAEIATDTIRHGGGGGELVIWASDDELVVQVTDTRPGMQDRLAGYTGPVPQQVGGWGMLIARTLCDAVQVRTGPHGTIMRARVRLPHAPHSA